MIKHAYETTEMEIISFESEDVITCSTGSGLPIIDDDNIDE